jgi:spore coat polysaccharide biosynthesis protein SpsF
VNTFVTDETNEEIMRGKMETLDAVLACRVNGTRLYGKPLQLIDIANQVTILENQVRHLKTSVSLNRICLAISSERENYGFIELAEKNGWEYVIGDPKDVLGRILSAADKLGSTQILRTTTENPFMISDRIDLLYGQHTTGNYDYSMYSHLPEGAGFSLLKVDALRTSHKKGQERHRSELVTSYIFDHKSDFRLNIQEIEKHLQRPDVRITVDYPEDLIFCRKVYQDLRGYERIIPIAEIVDYWDTNPGVRKIVENIGIDWGHGRIWA